MVRARSNVYGPDAGLIILTMSSSTSSCSLKSQLRLAFEINELGNTRLAERYHQGLFHVGKAYSDEGFLKLQIVNPTAGLFANDVLESNLLLRENCKVSLSSPSSTQIYTMGDGGRAVSEQNIIIEDRAFLELNARWIVPHKGSSFTAKTKIEMPESAGMFYADMLSPGRNAFGESMAFRDLRLSFQLSIGGKKVSQEKIELMNEQEKIAWIPKNWETVYLATLWIVSPDLPKGIKEVEEIEASFPEMKKTFIGATRLDRNITVVRIISESVISVHRHINNVREIFKKHILLTNFRY